MFHWHRAIALAAGLLLATRVVAGAGPTLNWPEALARILESNPQLQAAHFDRLAAAARIREQAQTRPWRLGLEVEDFAGSGELAGVDALETTLTLGRVLELGDKPGRRAEVARVEADLVAIEAEVERLDLLTEGRQRFIAAAAVEAERTLAEEAVELRRQTLMAVERRVERGRAPDAERARAAMALARAELELEALEHEERTSRRRLARLWGAVDPDFGVAEMDLMALPPLPERGRLESLVATNPDIARLTTQSRLAEARRRLAEGRRRPDLKLGGGLRHANGPGDVGLLFSVSLPLGTARRARPGVEAAQAEAEREPLLARDRSLALRATLVELVEALRHDRDVIEAQRERLLPLARQALADLSDGYGRGRYSLLELTQAQDRLLESRHALLDAALDYQRGWADLDRLTGGRLGLTAQDRAGP